MLTGRCFEQWQGSLQAARSDGGMGPGQSGMTALGVGSCMKSVCALAEHGDELNSAGAGKGAEVANIFPLPDLLQVICPNPGFPCAVSFPWEPGLCPGLVLDGFFEVPLSLQNFGDCL